MAVQHACWAGPSGCLIPVLKWMRPPARRRERQQWACDRAWAQQRSCRWIGLSPLTSRPALPALPQRRTGGRRAAALSDASDALAALPSAEGRDPPCPAAQLAGAASGGCCVCAWAGAEGPGGRHRLPGSSRQRWGRQTRGAWTGAVGWHAGVVPPMPCLRALGCAPGGELGHHCISRVEGDMVCGRACVCACVQPRAA